MVFSRGGHPAFRPIVTGRLVRVGRPASALPFPLPGKIEARAAGGDTFTASAGRNGRFRLPLPPGAYTVTGRSPLISGGKQPCRAGDRLRVTRHRADQGCDRSDRSEHREQSDLSD